MHRLSEGCSYLPHSLSLGLSSVHSKFKSGYYPHENATKTESSGIAPKYIYRHLISLFLLFVLSIVTAVPAFAALDVNKSYAPATAYPRQISVLSIELQNTQSTPISDVNFTDIFPDGTFVASTPDVVNDCGGTLTHSNSTLAGQVTVGGASIPAGDDNNPGRCSIRINVMAPSVGTYQNIIEAGAVSGTLSGNPISNVQASEATLTTIIESIGISINTATDSSGSFRIKAGKPDTLILTLQNNSPTDLTDVNFNWDMAGYDYNYINFIEGTGGGTCGGTVSVIDAGGSSTYYRSETNLSLEDGLIPANGSCTVTVQFQVRAYYNLSNAGTYGYRYNDLFFPASIISTTEGATNTLPSRQYHFAYWGLNVYKYFNDSTDTNADTIPGSDEGTATLRIKIVNYNAIDVPLTLTDVMPTAPGQMSVTQTGNNTCGGSLSTNGGTELTITDGLIAAADDGYSPTTCDIEATVSILANGKYVNTIPANSVVDYAHYETRAILRKGGGGMGVSKSKDYLYTTNGDETVYTYTFRNPTTVELTNVRLRDNFIDYDGTGGEFFRISQANNISSTCDGFVLETPVGSDAFGFSGVTIPRNSSCKVSVQLSANANDSHYSIYDNIAVKTDANSITEEGIVYDAGSQKDLLFPVEIELYSRGYNSLSPGMTFQPDIVESNGISRLRYEMRFFSYTQQDIEQVFMRNTLPAGLTIAAEPNATSSCDGNLSAVPGSDYIELSGGTMPGYVLDPSYRYANRECVVEIDIQAPETTGSYTNAIPSDSVGDDVADLEFTAVKVGEIAPYNQYINRYYSSDTLTVTPLDLPINKEFLTPVINGGEPSRVRITFSNTVVESPLLSGLSLTDDFSSSGLRLYSDVDARFTDADGSETDGCRNATITGNPGDQSITLSGAEIDENTLCFFEFNVTASVGGNHINTINAGDVKTREAVTNSATVSATLTVDRELNIGKAFAPAIVSTGQHSTLRLDIYNTNASNSYSGTSSALVDEMPAGLDVISIDSNSCGGVVTLGEANGNETLELSGGNFPPESSCTITATVTSNNIGEYVNSIPAGSLSTNENATNANDTSATLRVITTPTIRKDFSGNNIPVGGTSNIYFYLYNSDNDIPLTGANFTDKLNNMRLASPVNAYSNCVNFEYEAVDGGTGFNVTNSIIPANSYCYVRVAVTSDIPGSHDNITSGVTTDQTATGSPSNIDTLVVWEPPTLTKTFTPDLIAVGSTSTLTFTLINPNADALALEDRPFSFQDHFPDGMRIADAPNLSTDCPGVIIRNAADIGPLFPTDKGFTVEDGEIPANGSCTLSLDVTVSKDGMHQNVSSRLDTEVAGLGNAASAILIATEGTPAYDYSDAPLNGSMSPNGLSSTDYGVASHLIFSTGRLGNNITSESSAVENADNSSDDGLQISDLPLLQAQSSNYLLPAANFDVIGRGTLHAWIDFDGDGSFSASEYASSKVIRDTVMNDLAWSGHTTMAAGTTWMRIRFTDDTTVTSSTPDGTTYGGEVEDYAITVVPRRDFSDAPADGSAAPNGGLTAYGTANHRLSGNLRLGATITEEITAIEGADNASDDSISSFPGLTAGDSTYTLTANVSNTSGSVATLHAWIDFNGNGAFAANEYTTATVNNGATSATLTWNNMNVAGSGTTWVRLRLTTSTLTDNENTSLVDERSASAANDGEVEDYTLVLNPSSVVCPIGYTLSSQSGNVIGNAGATSVSDVAQSYGSLAADGASAGSSNSALLNGNNAELDLDLGNLVAPGTTLTLSIAQPSGGGGNSSLTEILVSTDDTTYTLLGSFGKNGSLGGSSRRGNLDHLNFTVPTGGIRYIRLDNADSDGMWVDGAAYTDICLEAPVVMDFSDGPADGSTASAGGVTAYGIASHDLSVGMKLGDSVTDETSAITDADNASDDALGITNLPVLTEGDSQYSIPADYLSASGNGTLHAWIDFNGNGSFDSVEHAMVYINNNMIDDALIWTGQTTMSAGTTYMRLRFTSDANVTASTPGGNASDGEVEDYVLSVANALFDYSDAPADGSTAPDGSSTTSYGTTNHQIVTGLYLGTAITNETSAIENADNASDDGLSLLPELVQGFTVSIPVNVTQSSANEGYLQAWADWNGNGIFEASEQIATDLQSAEAGTSTIGINTAIPATALTGNTFARLRWSRTSSLDSDSAASSGEVEDYAWTINSSNCSTVVTTTADSDALANNSGSLRDAIECANADPDKDLISFNIPGTGPHKILVFGWELPALTDDGITIDGTTQTGASCGTSLDSSGGLSDRNLLITIDGAASGTNANGLRIYSAADVTVKGVSIINFPQDGIEAGGSSNTSLICNHIGTGTEGATARPNNLNGIFANSVNGLNIGDGTDAGINLISGNVENGLLLEGTMNNVHIHRNFIGLGKDGSTPIGNDSDGIVLDATSNNMIIDHNVISDNYDGIYAWSSALENLTIINNYIGTDATGMTAAGNSGGGISASQGKQWIIGGPEQGNIISSNRGGSGIYLSQMSATIQGNLIGVGADGTTSLSNNYDGITLSGGGSYLVGGIDTGENNIIANNKDNGIAINADASDVVIKGNDIKRNWDDGVYVYKGTATINSNVIAGNYDHGVRVYTDGIAAISANSISGNYDLGIDLGTDSTVTANDAGDADVGGNELLNFPVINNIRTNGSNTLEYDFNLDVPVHTDGYRVEFFSNTSADSSGHGEGETYLGYVDINHSDGDQSFSGEVISLSAVATGDFISSTVSRKNSASIDITSEFSGSFAATLIQADYSDAPLDSTVAPDGISTTAYGIAIHEFDEHAGQLGTTITAETSAIEDADNASDDGVTISPLTAGQSSIVSLTVSGNSEAALWAWIDWNGDGDFNDTNEQIANAIADNFAGDINPADGIVEFIVNVPTDALTTASTYGRFRWSYFDASSPAGSVKDGEVEDYSLTIADGNYTNDYCVTPAGSTGLLDLGDMSTSNISGAGSFAYTDRSLPGFGTVDVTVDMTGGIHLANTTAIDTGARQQPWLDENLPVSGTAIYLEPNSGGTATVTYSFNQPTGNIELLLLDMDEEDKVTISATDSNGNNITDFSGWRYRSGDLSVWQNPDPVAQAPVWNAATAMLTSTDDANDHRSFGLLTPDTLVSQIAVNFTAPTTSGRHVYTVLHTTDAGRDGEICPTYDYGDAPVSGAAPDGSNTNSYGEARHTIASGIYLGSVAPDSDSSNQPSVNADGDDNNGNDDEDGISAFPTLTQNDDSYVIPANNISVSNTSGGNATLYGYIDFNGDGDFADTGESASVIVANGTNNPSADLNFSGFSPVPTTINNTFARLRLSTDSGLDATTAASDGEVEDYALFIDSVACSLIVTTTADSNNINNNSGSLRDAIECANSTPDVNTITFDMPTTEAGYDSGAGVWTIQPTSQLPITTSPVIIDGYSQPGSSPNTAIVPNSLNGVLRVEIDGSLITGETNGLIINSPDSLIQGLVINNFGASGTSNSFGISVQAGGDNLKILGNYIGSDAAGTAAKNNNNGIQINGTNNAVIGGLNPAERNLIAFNQGIGVSVIGTSNNNAILQNSIHSNSGLGIDLGGNGVSSNDSGDSDDGPNSMLNHPIIEQVEQTGTNVDVTYSLDIPAGNYHIEFFDNPSGIDPSGHGEGELSLGYQSVTHTGSGEEQFSFTLTGVILSDVARLSATVTEDLGAGNFGASSEFSTINYEVNGIVFEDLLYGGGNGRPFGTAGTVGANGVRLEIYNDAGQLVSSTDSQSVAGQDGTYSLTLPSAGQYYVRAVSASVSSNRSGSDGSEIGIMTFRTNGSVDVVNEVGGRNSAVIDAGINDSSSTLNTTTFTFVGGHLAGMQAQAVQPVLATGKLMGVSFGFNFNTIVNTNTIGQGSLQQFVYNSNLLDSTGLQQQLPAAVMGDYTSGDTVAIFMIPDILHASGEAIIELDDELYIDQTQNVIDGRIQQENIGSGIVVIQGAAATLSNGVHYGSNADGSILRNVTLRQMGGSGVVITGTGASSGMGVLIHQATISDNGQYGVLLESNALRNQLISNFISNNGWAGIANDADSNNTFSRNSIFNNGGLGIDLGMDGVTANDSTDSWLNYPDVTLGSTISSNGSQIVTYDLDLDVPANTHGYRMEFFSNVTAGIDPSGHGEGQTYLGYQDITHPGTGVQNFKGYLNANQSVPENANISVILLERTATDSLGATSEYSGILNGRASVCTDLLTDPTAPLPTVTIDENATNVTLLEALDDSGQPISYAISGGADSQMFVIRPTPPGALFDCLTIEFISRDDDGIILTARHSSTISNQRLLSQQPPPGDYEAPTDHGSDNTYDIEITATDSQGNIVIKEVSITVRDINEKPRITSTAAINYTERQSALVVDIESWDPDVNDAEGNNLIYSLAGGSDAEYFKLDPMTGALTFIDIPDYELPRDQNMDNQYEVKVRVMDDEGLSGTRSLTVTVLDDPEKNGTSLSVKALLQGAYDFQNGLMRDDLRSLGILPVGQPYNRTPFNHFGSEMINLDLVAENGADAMVDWVLLELRSAQNPTDVVDSHALLVQRDGDLMDATTGSTHLNLVNVPNGDYYVSLRHRNHLDVITTQPVTLKAGGTLIDFSNVKTDIAGEYYSRLISAAPDGAANAEIALLWSGDINQDQQLILTGNDSDINLILTDILTAPDNNEFNSSYPLPGYLDTDLNLDGETLFMGPANDVNFVVGNVLTHPDNTWQAVNFVMSGGL